MSEATATNESALTSGAKIGAGKAVPKRVATKPAKSAPAKAKPAAKKPTKAAKRAAPKAKTNNLSPDDGRNHPYRFTDDMAITLKVKANPYREGTDSHAAIEQALKCKTVGKYLAALAGKKQSPQDGCKFPFDYLRIARRNGVINVK